MNQKSLLYVLIVLLALCATPAVAAGPWKFVKSLPDKAAEVTLGESLALTVDAERRRYYVVDSDHAQLVSFDQQGQFLTSLNPGNRLQQPVALARASGGKFWVVERSVNQLLYVQLQEQQVRSFGLVSPDGLPIFPDKVEVDAKNRVFVLDRSRGAVMQLDDNLKVIKTYLGDKDFRGFSDFRLTADGLWGLDSLSHTLTLFADDGQLARQINLSGTLEFPVAFEVDATGNFYLLDRHAGKVVVFNKQGGFSYEFLLKGKRPGQLWLPSGLLLDWNGQLCVVNEGNGRIDIYSR